MGCGRLIGRDCWMVRRTTMVDGERLLNIALWMTQTLLQAQFCQLQVWSKIPWDMSGTWWRWLTEYASLVVVETLLMVSRHSALFCWYKWVEVGRRKILVDGMENKNWNQLKNFKRRLVNDTEACWKTISAMTGTIAHPTKVLQNEVQMASWR